MNYEVLSLETAFKLETYEKLKKQLEEKIYLYNNLFIESEYEIEKLNNKIDKAIEYLESYNTDFKNCRFGEAPISLRELGDLLDILKGSDKSE